MASLDPVSWLVAPYSWKAADGLTRELHLPPVAAMVLASRGLGDPEKAREFLACAAPVPDPFLLGDMEGAVSTISEALDRGTRIVVHGDYDADGITATALMMLGLRELGREAQWYLPSRFAEGYGLSRSAVESVAEGGPALLITVDCGVNYPDEVALARNLGLEVVVIDHHQPGPRLPECHLIHPVVGHYPPSGLCGVGLALKVMHGLHVHRKGAGREELPETLGRLLDLVAIGTIADLAPLLGENRYYVKEGIKLIGIGSRPGLRALAAVAGCQGEVDSAAVAFRLAPRLNAAGRLADASPPLRLLLTDDEEEAAEIANRLHELNGERQGVERQMLNEAVARVEELEELPPILVLTGEDWHEGVVGIVASRLVDRYQRPTILLGVREGVAKGSGRSIAGYDLMAGLDACARYLSVYGGHTQAVGLTMPAEQTDEFRWAMERHAGTVLRPSDLMPVYRADAVMRGEDINADTAVALASLGPFGSGNLRPRLLLVGADIKQPEMTRTGSHLRCVVELDGVRTRAIGFGMGEAADSLSADGRDLTLGVQLRVDKWQGSLRPELVIERIGGRGSEAEKLPDTVSDCDDGCRYREWPHSGEDLAPARRATVEAEPGRRRHSGDRPARLSLPVARDLRNRPGRWGALVQVLATGEPAVVLGCSVPRSLFAVARKVDRQGLRVGTVQCLGSACQGTARDRAATADVLYCEWDVAMELPAVLQARTHVIAFDPPYRAEHAALLREAAARGVCVHLCYGEDERRATAELLRYLVHPRFAMVCMYRAMGEGCEGEEASSRTALLGWREARVVLTERDLARARNILGELRIGCPGAGEAKIDAHGISAYAAGEAEYEECRRLCQIL